jgi:hypothetical protein
LLVTEDLCQVVNEVLLLVEEYLSKDPIIQLAVMQGYFLVCVLLAESHLALCTLGTLKYSACGVETASSELGLCAGHGHL